MWHGKLSTEGETEVMTRPDHVRFVLSVLREDERSLRRQRQTHCCNANLCVQISVHASHPSYRPVGGGPLRDCAGPSYGKKVFRPETSNPLGHPEAT